MDNTTVHLLVRTRRSLGSGEARRLRVGLGLSLREVADAYGFDACQLAQWEKGQTAPRMRSAERLAQMLSDFQQLIQEAS